MGKNKMQKLFIIKRLTNVILLNVALVFIKRCCKDSEDGKPTNWKKRLKHIEPHKEPGAGVPISGGEAACPPPLLLTQGLTSSGGFFTFCMYLRTTSSGFLPARTELGWA